ncbi:unnamed protein product [Bursaphelenchus okinawaensis]|uniref:NADP-dependent oxidoreductase domain-containing protein n=1 Tax=Bursaphelenchus okinawaensis TaxID=465554 RepID=A0A811KZ59_9BILA|nr:unnamed protein product [Bursaphelenchus okinawaensis]CAG9114176.1 unnamed protein product [Bursaphelenchus okinawaensis]
MASKTFKLVDGYQIPLFGLGTWQLETDSDCITALDAAFKAGYRLFDTAKYYRNEKQLGDALKKVLEKNDLSREDVFIETKANISTYDGDVKKTTKRMVEDSLAKLQTKYLDLVLIHYPKNWGVSDKRSENRRDRSDAYGVLEELQKAGKIRSIGVSNFEASHIDQLVEDGHSKPTVNQCEFHPHLTRPDLVEYCRKEGILFQAHTPLAFHTKSLMNDKVVNELMQKYDATFEQIMLAFPLKQSIGVVPKSSNPKRIEANFQSTKLDISDDDIEKLRGLNKDRHYSDCSGWEVS